MNYKERLHQFFREEKKLNNRQISVIMDGYSESLISRYLSQEDPNGYFLILAKKYFSDLDLNYIVSGERLKKNTTASSIATKFDSVIEKIRELKEEVSQE